MIKLLWFAFIILTGIFTNVEAASIYPIVTPQQHSAALAEQKKYIEAMKAEAALRKTPACHDHIIVNVAGYDFSIPREGYLRINLSDGQNFTDLDHHCDVKKIDHVVSFGSANLAVVDKNLLHEYKSQYDYDENVIKEGRKQGRNRILSDGTEEISKGYLYEYILPSKAAPTYDGKPVALNCPTNGDRPGELSLTDSCTTSYILYKDLGIWYCVFRKDYPVNGHILADQNRRNLVNSWIIQGNKK